MPHDLSVALSMHMDKQLGYLSFGHTNVIVESDEEEVPSYKGLLMYKVCT